MFLSPVAPFILVAVGLTRFQQKKTRIPKKHTTCSWKIGKIGKKLEFGSLYFWIPRFYCWIMRQQVTTLVNLSVWVVLSTSEWCLFTGILPLKRHSFWIIHSKVLCAQHKCHLGKRAQSGVGDWNKPSSSKHANLHICWTYVMLCQFAYPSIEMNDTCFLRFLDDFWCRLILNIWKNSLGIHSRTIETSKSLPHLQPVFVGIFVHSNHRKKASLPGSLASRYSSGSISKAAIWSPSFITGKAQAAASHFKT